jgi:ribosome maturation factor RimP
MRATAQERKIASIIQPAIADLGYDLVQVRLLGSQKLQTLQIMAENPKTGKLDLNGCTAISRSISAILDVEDPIPGAYQLEVSSPGLDRPLVKESDFETYNGRDISIETEIPDESGQKRYKGVLTGFGDGIVTIRTETGDVNIELENVIKAKLVLTDELVKAALKQDKQE